MHIQEKEIDLQKQYTNHLIHEKSPLSPSTRSQPRQLVPMEIGFIPLFTATCYSYLLDETTILCGNEP
ncbi:MAG: hypothetical protein CVV02_07835 [Firmicutes bacterium HGW-Firmicutes-7]|nr:MAG: hypothetical protein CVV02_07835 [Firmicutes bacterium HGW-Firmicutes-7]